MRSFVVIGLVASVSFASACRSTQERTKQGSSVPVVGSVDPPNGAPGGNNLVFVNGEGFDPRAPVQVTFGGKPSQRAIVLTKNKIQAQAPPGLLGQSVRVKVTFPSGATLEATNAYRYGDDDEGPEHEHEHESQVPADAATKP